jgi:hypothetical protein
MFSLQMPYLGKLSLVYSVVLPEISVPIWWGSRFGLFGNDGEKCILGSFVFKVRSNNGFVSREFQLELKLSTQLFLSECWGKITVVHFGVIKLDNI